MESEQKANAANASEDDYTSHTIDISALAKNFWTAFFRCSRSCGSIEAVVVDVED